MVEYQDYKIIIMKKGQKDPEVVYIHITHSIVGFEDARVVAHSKDITAKIEPRDVEFMVLPVGQQKERGWTQF